VILALSTGDVVGIVIGAVVLILLLFFLGGSYALSRRRAADEADLKQRIEAADAALADARAEDKGWERGTIEAAARAAVAPREVRQLHLIQVVDKPGTDADQAVFRVVHADGGEQTLTLGRRDGDWVAV
jgi:hypothetical protein